MVRDSDSVAEFRHALTRIMDRLDKHEERFLKFDDRQNTDADVMKTHILKCEAAGQSAARDLSDMRAEMKGLKDMGILAAKVIIPLIALSLAVQILGVERTWHVYDSIKSVREIVPLPDK